MTVQLDNDIAEKVMGWKKTPSGPGYWHLRHDDEYESIACSRVGKAGRWTLHDGVGGGSPFTPSEWPEHCNMLKERLRELGIGFSISYGKDKVSVTRSDVEGVMFSYRQSRFVEAESEEMAVALFAKALVELKVIR